MSDPLPILSALLPLFGLILVGRLLAGIDFPGPGFWPQLERFIYFVLFPALLIEGLGTAALDAARIPPMLTAAALTLGAGSVLAYLLRPLLRLSGPAFSSLYQGGIRFNTYLGIAVVLTVFGEGAMAVTALTIALMVPLINVACVLVLARHAGARQSPGRILLSLAGNPLIIGCGAGLALNLSGVGLHPWLATGLDTAGSAAVPLGLMSVGAGLHIGRMRSDTLAIALGSLLKLLALPAIAWAAAGAVGLNPLETQVLVVFAALPTATSAYILARQMGGDHGLLAGILTVQTALAAVTLPLVLTMLASHGG